jgi:DNA-binding MarR family transcriptional regulator
MTSKRSQSASTQGPSGFELENFLPYRLSVLTNTVSQGIARSYRDRHDITVTEWRVMAVLGRYAGLTASEVVERTAMDKVAISRAVNSLVAKDLLERKTDRDDRRRRRLYVSHARGRQVLEEIVPQARECERLLLQSLSAEEIETLERTMDALLVAARKTGEGEFPGGDRR